MGQICRRLAWGPAEMVAMAMAMAVTAAAGNYSLEEREVKV